MIRFVCLTRQAVACVQTSPHPQKKKNRKRLPIFSKGGGTSVHRLAGMEAVG